MSETGLRAAFLRRKPIDDVEPEDGGLQRTLGLWQLTAIGIGGIIGAGIFSLAGAVANEKAGPAVLVSFLIAGVASAAAAFSYAEFAGMIPRAGSAYTYGYVVLGEFAAGSSAGICSWSTPRSSPSWPSASRATSVS